LDIQSTNDGRCFLKFKNCHFGSAKGIVFEHIVLKNDIHINPINIEKMKSSFSKEEEEIVNILKAKKLLLKIHSRLCNPSIPPHKKIQTNI
jgi:DNA replicative helicase MCM subunit Mcm2 (Cdc46/Mcm family)